MAASDKNPAADPEGTRPYGLPWSVNPEEPRVIRDRDRRMVGAMDTPSAALLAVEAANASDVDARREVTHLRARLDHYRHRSQMAPSERQFYLGESVEESIQPERYYIDLLRQPTYALLTAIKNAKARVDLGEQQPADALTDIVAALEPLDRDTRGWFAW